MIFTSIHFWAVFIVFLTIFALLRRSTRTGMMLYVTIISLYFFFFANRWLMQLLPLTALISWSLTKAMKQYDGAKRKVFLLSIILLDLIPLVYFKYADFAVSCLNSLWESNFSLPVIALPVGISFYTFQAISYSIDVYRKKFTMDITFLEYIFYLSFFPLLFAGPITRAETFFPQVRRHQPLNERMAYMGLWLIIMGILKKAVVADYIAQYNNWIFGSPLSYSGFENLMGLFGFSLQIYLDFSGYSDISIGIAALMGIRLRDNFRFPYQSLNVTEFWHRWHISLSSWFRDYVYIPLGGNKYGRIRTGIHCLITFLLVGIWHGSTVMYALWGLMHGLAMVVHKAMQRWLRLIPDTWATKPFSMLLTATFIICGWAIFRSPDLDTASLIFKQIFTNFRLESIPAFWTMRPTWLMMLIVCGILLFVRERYYNRLMIKFIYSPWLMKLIAFAIAIQLAIEFHSSNITPFLYYNF
ncbi:MAG: MBOAT family protein [Bacteroidaceae bacterium]|nr:MBOAT family protein [Bacteroidaceae bacterium]MBR1902381.1 MBOAT family protein [Bacteroidaceae bacterium]